MLSEVLMVSLPLVGALVNTGLGLYSVRIRSVPAARSFGIAMLLVAVWGYGYALEVATPDFAGKLLWLQLRCPLFFITTVWFVMTLQLTGRDRRLRIWHILLLCVIPALAAIMQAFPATMPLIRRELQLTTAGALPMLAWRPGPFFLLYLAQSYVLGMASTVLLLLAWLRARGPIRTQTALVALNSVIVLLVNLLALILPRGQAGYDFTPMVFGVSGSLTMLAIFRYGMFSLVPFAQRIIVESMPNPVLVLDTEHRIILANAALRRLVGQEGSALLGQPTREVFRRWSDLVEQYYDVRAGGGMVIWGTPEQSVVYELSITPLTDDHSRLLGRLLMLHDVTELTRTKEAAEEALANARTLGGLLPICASCKSIRNDEGYWLAVEHYMAAHTDVEFTHGLCPQCAVKMQVEAEEHLAAMRRRPSPQEPPVQSQ